MPAKTLDKIYNFLIIINNLYKNNSIPKEEFVKYLKIYIGYDKRTQKKSLEIINDLELADDDGNGNIEVKIKNVNRYRRFGRDKEPESGNIGN